METSGAEAPSNVTLTCVAAPVRSQIEEEEENRREREIDKEDGGIAEPSRGETLIARRVQTYNEGNVENELSTKVPMRKERCRVALLVLARRSAKGNCVSTVAN